MLPLYNTVLLPLRPVVAVWAFWSASNWRGSRPSNSTCAGRSGLRREWDERRARLLPNVAHGGVWLHGSSVGEARIVGELARGLRVRRPARAIAASAFTSARRAQLPGTPEVDAAFFLPLDFRGYVERFLGALRPALLVLVETELWPNLLTTAHRRNVASIILNGRLSERRMARYQRWIRLYRPCLQSMLRVGAQTQDDADRFVTLGVPRELVQVTGNIKYDLPPPTGDAVELRRRLRLAPGRPVFVAGSTGADEEPLVLRAFERARQRFPALYLVIAPRHTRRAVEVAELLRERGLRFARLSHVERDAADDQDALLVDNIGHLSDLYQLASVAFVGGSLVPVGGHNLLEPAAAGAPVLYGPHVQNVSEPAGELERAGAGQRVRDDDELAAALTELLGNASRRDDMASRARQVLAANRGALSRSLDLLTDVLDGRE